MTARLTRRAAREAALALPAVRRASAEVLISKQFSTLYPQQDAMER